MKGRAVTARCALAAGLALVVAACSGSAGDRGARETGAGAAPGDSAATHPQTIADIGLASPETVLYDAVEDVYLVSNINGDASAADGNGFISKLAPDGHVLTLKWIEGGKNGATLNGPKGMIYLGDTLFVADVDAVRLFNLRSGAPMGERPMPGRVGLNDLAIGSDGRVYVTDLGPDSATAAPAPKRGKARRGEARTEQPGGAVLRLEAKGGTPIAEGPNLERPDGIVGGSGKLFVAPFGGSDIYQLPLPPVRRGADSTRSPAAADSAPAGADTTAGGPTRVAQVPTGTLDGLLRLADGAMLVTSWQGSAVYRIAEGGKVDTLATGIDSPAQMGLDTRRGRLLVPSLRKNAIVVLPLPESERRGIT